jgi:hypothetical protein
MPTVASSLKNRTRFNEWRNLFGTYKPYHHAVQQQQKMVEKMCDVISFRFYNMNLIISLLFLAVRQCPCLN